MSLVKTLSERGKPIDYRPATHHSLFKIDGNFDFRYDAVRHCYFAIKHYAQQVFWINHKELTETIIGNILQSRLDKKLNLTCVITGRLLLQVAFITAYADYQLFLLFVGLSDGDRAFVITQITHKVDEAIHGLVVDIHCHRGDTSTSVLQTVGENLRVKLIDKHNLYKSKVSPVLSVSPEVVSDTPLKALAQLLELAAERSAPQHLVVLLRHCEMLDIHTLDNLIVQLSAAGLPCTLHLVAFTDKVCQLPVQLSQAAQAQLHHRVLSTASPWDMYESVSSRMFSAQHFPLVFSPALVLAIRVAFEESELCVTSALER